MNSEYTYRSCPGCGFDSCICEHVPTSEEPSTSATQPQQEQQHSAQHGPQQQQNRPLKIKLNLATSILPNTNKSPPALLPFSHGSAVPTPHTKQLKKLVRPPKTGRFALPHSHSRGAYNPRGRAGPTSHKSNIAKAKHGAARRGLASNKKKGGRGSYRHDDDDYYYDGSFPTFVTAISSSSEDDDEMDEELAVYHHRAPPVVPAPVTGPRLGKELLVPTLPHQDEDDDEEVEDEDEDDSDVSSDLTDPDDISIQASEERFIIAEERARVRRELMGQDDVGGNGHKQRFDWQATPSKRSNSSSSGGSDTDSDSENSSDEDVLVQDDEDDNAEDEAEPDVALGRAATTPLAERSDCSSDSDDFDAAVFFASLDSDHEEKAAEADDDETSTVSEINVPRMQDSAYPVPIISQDGMLGFGDPLSMLDAPFDIPTAVPSPNYCGDTTESDDDDEQMDVDTDQGATEDEDGFGTDDGETTDDMDEDEIAEILAPRFATPPPQGVDPLVLHLTPIAVVPQPPVVRRPTPPRTVTVTPTTRPRTMSLSTQSISSWGSMSPPAPPAMRMPKLPSMGRFESPGGPVPPTPGEPPKVVVIDGTSKDIPSPFARKIRSGLMRGRPKRYAKRRYHSLSPLNSGGDISEDSMVSFASIGIPSTSSYIDIHDVLDEAILEDDEDTFVDSQTTHENPFQSASESDAATHSRNLTRWDRVPMNTFRRTRSDATHSMEFDSAIDLTMEFAIGLPSPTPYSYGNALKSPGAHTTKWWEPDRSAGSGSKRSKRHPSASMQAALAMSPMLFPMSGGSGDEGDGPSFRRMSSSQNSSPHKIHRKKERRALKNRSVDSAAVKPQKRMSHVQRASSVKRVSPLRL